MAKVTLLPGESIVVEFEDEENVALRKRVAIDFAKSDDSKLRIIVVGIDGPGEKPLLDVDWAELCR
jgi:hypothetical protein